MFNQVITTRDQNEHGNPGDTLTYAHEYLDRGFVPIPVEFKSKACTLKDWLNYRVIHDEVETLFRPPCNIGVVLGERSGGLVDIDLDCEEAIALAPHILPPTAMRFGRQSSRAAIGSTRSLIRGNGSNSLILTMACSSSCDLRAA